MKLAFADCILDLAARQLSRGGQIVPLEPKMYQLLEVLIQRRPAVVTNERLDEIRVAYPVMLDRRTLVYLATDADGSLTRFFLNGDSPLPLVAEYSIDPVWSPDGQFLVYSGADVGTAFPLRAAAADGRPYPLPAVMLSRGARRVAFFRDPQTLVILSGEIGHKNFSLLDLRTGAQHPLAELPADFVIRDFDISTTGSEIVFDRVQVNSDLALIEQTR